jgi:hypothetical protein
MSRAELAGFFALVLVFTLALVWLFRTLGLSM